MTASVLYIIVLTAYTDPSSSEAIIGGVVAVVFMITIALTVIAIVALLRNRNRKGVYFTGTQQKRYYSIDGYITTCLSCDS